MNAWNLEICIYTWHGFSTYLMIHTYINTFTLHIYTYIHMHPSVHSCTHKHKLLSESWIYILIFSVKYLYLPHVNMLSMYVCMYAYICWIFILIYTYIYIVRMYCMYCECHDWLPYRYSPIISTIFYKCFTSFAFGALLNKLNMTMAYTYKFVFVLAATSPAGVLIGMYMYLHCFMPSLCLSMSWIIP